MRIDRPYEPRRNQFSLVESPLPLTRSVERNGNDQITREGFPLQAIFQDVSERVCERHTIRVLQMMNHLAQRMCEEQSGSREIKGILTLDA